MLVCFGMPNAVWRQCDVCATAKASDGMLLSRVPIPGCCSPLPLGPTSAFQEIGLGLLPTSASGRATGTQPTSVIALGGPAVSIQLRQGPRAAGGPRNLPTARPGGPHIARWAARCAAAAAAGLQPAKHAAGGLEPTPGRCCGLGPRASPSHRTGDSAATGRTSPPERLLPVCSLPFHRLRAAYGSCMLRYQARQLCWRKCRVAAASSGLVCARPKLLGASFACDFDRECQMRRRFVDATQRAGSFARCASSTLISVRSCGLWRLTGG